MHEIIPQPGETIEVNGKEYTITSVDLSAEMVGTTLRLAVHVRTAPVADERVEVTIIRQHHRLQGWS